ncbi:MAG: hypothetical protein LBT89_04560, partial [Planctomycetaceae bacterium]|nr:hypothetical protein [Planctomycetaceae bacterium]
GGSYTGLTWGPDTLDKEVQAADDAIKKSKYTAADAGLIIIDYAKLSEKIKEPIVAEPYETATLWQPTMMLNAEPREDVAILPPEFDSGIKAVRGKPDADGNTMSISLSIKNPIDKQRELYETAFKGKVKGANPKNEPEYISIVLERAEIGADPFEYKQINLPKQSGSKPVTKSSADNKVTAVYKYDDTDIEPEKSYSYRVKLVAKNPNYGLSPDVVVDGVDVKNPEKESDWSAVRTVYVPSQTSIHIAENKKVKPSKWTAYAPFAVPKGTVNIVKFDDVGGKELPPLPLEVFRGTVCNLNKREITAIIRLQDKEKDKPKDSGGKGERSAPGAARKTEAADMYFSEGEEELKSDICVADILPEFELPKVNSKESKTTPDMTIPGKMLFIMPNGTLRVQAPEEAETAQKQGSNEQRRDSRGGGRERGYDREYDEDGK